MAEALAIGGWFASPAVTKLYDTIRSFISDRYQIATGVKRKLQSLDRSVGKIKAVIGAVEKGITEDPNVVSWLNDLKDAVYDAEDVLDLFDIQYPRPRRSVEASGSKGCSTVRKYVKKAQVSAKRFFFPDDSLPDLSDIVDKFDRLSQDIGTFLEVVKHSTDSYKEGESSKWRQTTPVPQVSEMFGRRWAQDRLLELVSVSSDKKGSNSENFSDVSIVGESSERRQTSPVPAVSEMFGGSWAQDRPQDLVSVSSDKKGSNSENFSVVSIVGESSEWRQTSQVPAVSEMFGRSWAEDRPQDLVSVSSDKKGSNSENFSVVSIVGIGGMGKTTLAQWLYNLPSIKNEFEFNLMAWVCVSDRFNMEEVMIKIIESASKRVGASRCVDQSLYNRKNVGTIHEDLSILLSGKKFLIVLDDVWNDMTTTDWDKLISVFRYGKEGSKIVITTRVQRVADKVSSMATNTINLAGLEDEEYWQLFKCYAFGDENPKDHPQLEHIGKQIVSKLGGLPLAAKVVGGVLRSSLEERHWRGFLENKEWKKEDEKDKILPSLRLSYNHLPPYLKQCFLYCALFPKGYFFKADKLVSIWVAQGYVQSSDDGNKTLEDIGREYFNELYTISFFQNSPWRGRVVIHDLLHDLAETTSRVEIYRVENDSSMELKIPRRVRHLFVNSGDLDNVLDQIEEPKKLRSLVYDPPCTSSIPKISRSNFKKLRGLHVLILGKHYSSSHLLETIGHMLHLRYLESPCGTKLPISLGRLYYLQVLALSSMQGIDDDQFIDDSKSMFHCFNYRTTLSKIFGKMINLRYIKAPMSLVFAIPIGKLTSLQRLLKYEVREHKGQRICELRNLNEIHGRLCIARLENVANKEEAKRAQLHKKVWLEDLSLHWNAYHSSNEEIRVQEEVLEELQPSSDIKNIYISGYMGLKHPRWLNKSYLSNIKSILLVKWGSLKVLPPLGEFPFLEILSLNNLVSLETIGLEAYGDGDKVFPSLQHLWLIDLKELKEWSGFKEDVCNMMPLLSHLRISNCNKLEALPPLGGLQCLTDLHLSQLDSLAKIGTESYGTESVVFPKLKSLHLADNKELKAWLAPNDGQSLMPHLTDLFISRCSNLKFISPLGELRSLEVLRLQGLDSLEKINIAFPSLKHLELSNMSGLTEWCALEEQGHVLMPCLQKLEILNCYKLKRPIHYSSNLEELRFSLHENVDDVQIFDELFPVGGLTCLKRLTLGPLKGLESFTAAQQKWFQNLTSLRVLTFHNCSDLQRLPNDLGSLCCLEILELLHCCEIVLLGQNSLPKNLKKLRIVCCGELHKLCDWRQDGSEWSKISHIPLIEFITHEGALEVIPHPPFLPAAPHV